LLTERDTEHGLAIEAIGPYRVGAIGPQYTMLAINRDRAGVLRIGHVQENGGIGGRDLADTIGVGYPQGIHEVGVGGERILGPKPQARQDEAQDGKRHADANEMFAAHVLVS
jgi:hypothetical protein